MNIFIHGVGVANRGAELMLCAILEQVGRRFPNARFAVDPVFGTFEQRAAYGLRTMMRLRRGVRSHLIDRLASPGFRDLYGLMHDSEVNVVLDGSGFAFGDQWGTKHSHEFIERCAQWKANGATIILLPQALGPFEKPDVRRALTEMLKFVDLVYAREETSFQHVRAVGGETPSLRKCHDFTNLVKGVTPEGLELPDRFAAIVPNQKILAKGQGGNADVYVQLLVNVAECVQTRGMEPVLVLHSTQGDRAIADSVQAAVGKKLACLEGYNGRELKAILGQAQLVAGSRFHSLVSSLSQGVPSLATSWSHKYEELFSEYGCPELVLPIDASKDSLAKLIGELTDGDRRDTLVQTLRSKAAALRSQAVDMFREVGDLMESKCRQHS